MRAMRAIAGMARSYGGSSDVGRITVRGYPPPARAPEPTASADNAVGVMHPTGFQRNIRAHRSAPFRRPSETPAQEVGRHGCRASPDLYRDVLSGRASVAGEFVRVARLAGPGCRGKTFAYFGSFAKVGRPRGRNETVGQARSGAEHRSQGKSPSPQPSPAIGRGSRSTLPESSASS